ncbi:site-specific integrase [uncultured Pseudoteredinibacter sp.]|uniref:site-specific integrase n=1 Tax=uncultured Pseudoteredinibacter sp. TaxID=1641701 RepID=UPI0026224672|nr:site-specific integrase [uncultured Pseudoteredinibacter sp.]
MARRWAVVLEDISQAYGNQPEDYSNAVRALVQHSKQVPIGLAQIKEIVVGKPVAQTPIQLNTKSSFCLSSALKKYLAEKRKTWNPKAIDANERNLGLKIETFIQIVGDRDCATLNTSHVLDYKGKLLQLPANRTKRKEYRSLSLAEVLDMEIPESHLLSAETLSGHLNKVSAFLDWGYRNGLMKADLKLPLQRVIKKPKRAISQRDAFSPDDLKKLFNSDQYLNGNHKQPSHFFVPLLALFTGARQNELCQLYKTDVYREQETGIWVLDINENGDEKHLKKPSHARMVPIHPQLIELGFINFVESTTTERLFTDLKFKRDGYGQSFSRWFNETYRNSNNCNVGQGIGESKNFHSFRHTFITKMMNEYDIPQHKIAHIVGHRPNDGSETTQRYTKLTEIKARYKIIELIEYSSVDFDAIRRFL